MFPHISVNGAPRERGRQYGAQVAPRVRHSIASYARLFAYQRGMNWAAAQAEALAYCPLLEHHAPGLLEEMRGIAEGAERSLAEIVALNARTELLAGARRQTAHPEYGAAMASNQHAGVPEHGECTTIGALPGATAQGGALLAQTWDWHGDQRAACVLLEIHTPGQPTILTLTEAGMLAKIGLNGAGLGVSLNILFSHSDGAEPGMPVHVQLRRVLEAHSTAEAIERITGVRAGASSCITLLDASGRGVSLEITPEGVSPLHPRDGLLVHTNHCVTPTAQANQRPLLATSASEPRFDRASELLRQAYGRIDVATLAGVLRDHQDAPGCICRHPDLSLPEVEQIESVTAVILDLAARELHVAPGLPCATPFERWSLERR